ncbi:MAG TPA: hypothetical protein VF743_05325, partial [Acidimicrobiales bacterium]
LGIVAGVVPCQAYDDPDVRDAAPQRLSLIELARVLPAGELGATVAPVLAPYPCDRKLAAEHQAEQRDAVSAAEVAAVPGAERELAEALVEGVRSGLAGVEADVEAQYQPFPVDLQSIRGANRLWWGAEDTVTPPVFGAWYAAQLPGAELDLEAGAGHHLLLTRWATIVRALADLV